MYMTIELCTDNQTPYYSHVNPCHSYLFLDSRIFFGIIQPSNRSIEVLATTPEKGRAPKSSLAFRSFAMLGKSSDHRQKSGIVRYTRNEHLNGKDDDHPCDSWGYFIFRQATVCNDRHRLRFDFMRWTWGHGSKPVRNSAPNLKIPQELEVLTHTQMSKTQLEKMYPLVI